MAFRANSFFARIKFYHLPVYLCAYICGADRMTTFNKIYCNSVPRVRVYGYAYDIYTHTHTRIHIYIYASIWICTRDMSKSFYGYDGSAWLGCLKINSFFSAPCWYTYEMAGPPHEKRSPKLTIREFGIVDKSRKISPTVRTIMLNFKNIFSFSYWLICDVECWFFFLLLFVYVVSHRILYC